MKRDPFSTFIAERAVQVKKNKDDGPLRHAAGKLQDEMVRTNYSHNWLWMGRPIIQFPTDMFVMQELIWRLKPDVIIETGTAWGGSAIFYASIMEIMKHGQVITIDVDIRDHNRKALFFHPLRDRITLVEGDSISDQVVTEVQYLLSAGPDDEPLPENPVIMVCLDSNHSHDHVLQELKLYSPMVTKGSYIVVFDTAVELTGENPKDRPWGPGDNPYTAVDAFMKGNEDFEIDTFPHVQALISEAPCGYLRRIR